MAGVVVAAGASELQEQGQLGQWGQEPLGVGAVLWWHGQAA